MLVMHTGRPGSGKSYNAVVAEIVPALKAGRAVITNMPLQVSELEADIPGAADLIQVLPRLSGQPAPFSELEHYTAYDKWRHPEDPAMGPLFVIDEASQSLPGSGRGTVPEDVKFWYEEHRHTGAKVVLITQQRDYVVKSIRNLSEYVYDFKNLGLLGMSAAYVKRTYDGAATGGKPVKVQWPLWYRAKYFRYYKSHTKGGGVVKEKNASLLRQWRVLAVVGVIGWWMLSQLGLFGSDEPAPDDQAPPAQVTQQQTAPAPTTALPVSEAVASTLAALEEQRRLLDAQRALQLAQLELELVNASVCDYATGTATARQAAGGGMFGGRDQEVIAPSACRLVPRPAGPPKHLLAGATVRIAATLGVEGDKKPSVWIAVRRGGEVQQVRADSLRLHGWRFTWRKDCEVAVHGPWEGILTCDWLEVPA